MLGNAGLHEVRVQRMRRFVGHGGARGVHGLSDHLAAEDAPEAVGLAVGAKTVVAQRFQVESPQ